MEKRRRLKKKSSREGLEKKVPQGREAAVCKSSADENKLQRKYRNEAVR